MTTVPPGSATLSLTAAVNSSVYAGAARACCSAAAEAAVPLLALASLLLPPPPPASLERPGTLTIMSAVRSREGLRARSGPSRRAQVVASAIPVSSSPSQHYNWTGPEGAATGL